MKANADKARALDTAELAKQLRDTGEQMFRIRFQLSMGQAEGVTKLRALRKEKARMLTILREREISGAAVAPKPAAKPAKVTAKPVAAPKAEKVAKPAAAKKTAVKKAPAAPKTAKPKASKG
jgi:large subunit ribosomal protein L29